MRDDFYSYLQWDADTGQPRPEALEAVGLAKYAVGPA